MLQVELHQNLSVRTSILERFLQTGPLAPKAPAAGQFGEGLNRGRGTVSATSVLVTSLMKGPVNPLLARTSVLIGAIGFTILALVLFFSRRAFTGEEKRAGSEMTQAVAMTNRG